MSSSDEIDAFFAMAADNHVEFSGNNDHPDVPVLLYRWCRDDAVANCPVNTLVEFGRQSMIDGGLKRVVCEGHHLRGDTDTGQRVKVTVVRGAKRTMYLLMTAGLPGTRGLAKSINSRLATSIERHAKEWSETAEQQTP